jgi:hypothetical protein
MDQSHFCSRCGGHVAPDARHCPHCKVILSGIGKGDEQERRRLRRAYLKRKWASLFRIAIRRFAIALAIGIAVSVAYFIFTKVILRWWRLSALTVAIPIILFAVLVINGRVSNWLQSRAHRLPREKLFSYLGTGDLKGVTRIIQRYPEACSAVDKQRNNAMHIAANYGTIDIVKFLLRQDGYGPYRNGSYGPYAIRLDEENCDGLTPLHVAELKGFAEIAVLIRGEQIRRDDLKRKMRTEEDSRKLEETAHAKMIAATTERTIKELELRGKQHYAICTNCGTAHDKPIFRPERSRELWYCKACGSCLGRHDLYDGGTVVSSTPRFPRI